jgi:arylsulfatase
MWVATQSPAMATDKRTPPADLGKMSGPEDGSKEGGGTLKLFVNGKPAGEGKLKRSAFRHGLEPFEVGRDSITPIDLAYKSKGEFPFTGSIERVTFAL